MYAGSESPYPHSTDIYDCFEDPVLARREMFSPLRLMNLTVLTQQELLKDGKSDLLLILLKEGIKHDFLKWIKDNPSLVNILLNRPYGISGFHYILEVDEKDNSQELIIALIEAAPEKKEVIMTAAMQLRQEGRVEGIQAKAIDIAKKLLKKGFDLKGIQEITDLSKEEIEKLKKESN